MKHAFLILFSASMLLSVSGCGGSQSSSGSAVAHDLTTPEKAILSLEEAYRNRDIEAAVSCRDFNVEASVMLESLSEEMSGDPEILKQTAEVLELGYRAELQNTGFPDFRGITSTFSDSKPFRDHQDIVELTETCSHSDGTTTTNQMVVAKTEAGWKVISVVDPAD
jgi:hypothetical protein